MPHGRAGNDWGGGGSLDGLDGEVRGAAGALHGLEKRVRTGAHSPGVTAWKACPDAVWTQCQRLGIRIIAARSPQAKGRVERNHGTHQDRLVKKLRRKKIRTQEQVNRYLETGYCDDHNHRFAIEPKSDV